MRSVPAGTAGEPILSGVCRSSPPCGPDDEHLRISDWLLRRSIGDSARDDAGRLRVSGDRRNDYRGGSDENPTKYSLHRASSFEFVRRLSGSLRVQNAT